VRVTKTVDANGRLGTGYHDHSNDLRRGQRGVPPGEGAPVQKTLGWRPDCECGGDPVPQIVLDPFCGKGTTARRAKELGRRYLTCDLNEEYCELAGQELSQAELF
jgi:SAM-dependent methyltransferase